MSAPATAVERDPRQEVSELSCLDDMRTTFRAMIGPRGPVQTRDRAAHQGLEQDLDNVAFLLKTDFRLPPFQIERTGITRESVWRALEAERLWRQGGPAFTTEDVSRTQQGMWPLCLYVCDSGSGGAHELWGGPSGGSACHEPLVLVGAEYADRAKWPDGRVVIAELDRSLRLVPCKPEGHGFTALVCQPNVEVRFDGRFEGSKAYRVVIRPRRNRDAGDWATRAANLFQTFASPRDLLSLESRRNGTTDAHFQPGAPVAGPASAKRLHAHLWCGGGPSVPCRLPDAPEWHTGNIEPPVWLAIATKSTAGVLRRNLIHCSPNLRAVLRTPENIVFQPGFVDYHVREETGEHTGNVLRIMGPPGDEAAALYKELGGHTPPWLGAPAPASARRLLPSGGAPVK